MERKEITICSITDFKIGNAQHDKHGTGCTAILSPDGAIAGVDVRGGAPGTRETDLLRSENTIDKVHAVTLSGGSAFGLEAASGVSTYLEEQEIGFDTGAAKVPIVPSAILFDLGVGNPHVRPDKNMGYQAAKAAWENQKFEEGNKGCGTGASVGKCLGPDYAMKSGLGSYAMQIGDLKIGAVIGVNAFGDVINPDNGQVIAGALNRETNQFLHSEEQMINLSFKSEGNPFPGNTVIGAVLTNAAVTKAHANKISAIAHNGIARTIRPAHTLMDGDTLFTMATGKVEIDTNTVAILAAYVTEKAIVKAVLQAWEAYGLPAAASLE